MNQKNYYALFARIMIIGVIIAAVVILAGLVIFLFNHPDKTYGAHVFKGEPNSLVKPIDIIRDAFAGNERSLIQLGIFILLLNPFVRVILALIGFVQERNKMYVIISLIVFSVLLFSFFF